MASQIKPAAVPKVATTKPFPVPKMAMGRAMSPGSAGRTSASSYGNLQKLALGKTIAKPQKP